MAYRLEALGVEPGVANIAALKAITDLEDKEVIFVASVNALYRYDASSTAINDDMSLPVTFHILDDCVTSTIVYLPTYP